MAISKNKAKIRIAELRRDLKIHNERYYVNNNPLISDFEYDILMQELITLEKMYPEFIDSNSPTMVVGSDISNEKKSGFEQKAHVYPMLSLGNTYNISEIRNFDEKVKKSVASDYTYCCELKFDGTAICLTYLKGELVSALTRGDGKIGDEVLNNVRHIKNIPTKLHGNFLDKFEIRGEIYMPFSAFDRLNIQREIDEDQPFANPRNAASGSLKLINENLIEDRGLETVLYHMPGDNLPFKKHSDAIEAAHSWGIPVSPYIKICKNVDEAIEFIQSWDEKRHSLPFPTDGMVIKVNELDIQKQLGYTSKFPRWATAYKFKPEEALTKVNSIDYQVGRTGAVTPVANLDSVLLSGTMVKRATLHNIDQMKQLDIRIGDYVYVEKGGEIIPKITRVELSKRSQTSSSPKFPLHCPDCNTLLVRDEDEARYYCPNSDHCPTQIKFRFLHFVSRKTMKIAGGQATIEQLLSKGYIKNFADLYKLTKTQLLTLDGWKEKSADNFISSLEESKKIPFGKVLFALGIRNVGEQTALTLASWFKDIDQLISASKEDLIKVEDIGDTVADSILEYFSNTEHLEMIKELKNAGVTFKSATSQNTLVSSKLEDCLIVISGVFSVPRSEIKSLIVANGGKCVSSLSGKTTYLLAGDNPGPEKIKKAEKIGTRIINEDVFRNLIS